MKTHSIFSKQLLCLALVFTMCAIIVSCNQATTQTPTAEKKDITAKVETPEYYNFRPALEKEYGYTHAVKIGNHIKIIRRGKYG